MANLQQALQKATFATVITTDKLLGVKNDPSNTSLQFKELITSKVDVVALLGHADHELSHLWREELIIKPTLKRVYHPAHTFCSSEKITAPTKYRFGVDLAKQIRDAKETNRIGNAVGSSKHDYRPIHPTPRGLTGVTVLTNVGLQTGSIFWGKVPMQPS